MYSLKLHYLALQQKSVPRDDVEQARTYIINQAKIIAENVEKILNSHLHNHKEIIVSDMVIPERLPYNTDVDITFQIDVLHRDISCEDIIELFDMEKNISKMLDNTEFTKGQFSLSTGKLEKEYFFTFGSDEKFPFGRNDYVKVIAESRQQAGKLFQTFFPNREGSHCINCADYYNANEWYARVYPNYYKGTEPIVTLDSTQAISYRDNKDKSQQLFIAYADKKEDYGEVAIYGKNSQPPKIFSLTGNEISKQDMDMDR